MEPSQTSESSESEEDEYAFDEKKVNSPFHPGKRARSSSLEDSSSNKKRKADNPKKQSGTISETFVPKKPKNLFMMN